MKKFSKDLCILSLPICIEKTVAKVQSFVGSILEN